MDISSFSMFDVAEPWLPLFCACAICVDEIIMVATK